MADTLRDTSIQAVRQLLDLGVKTVMLTGDNETTVEGIARQVGIDQTRGDVLLEDKLAVIEELLPGPLVDRFCHGRGGHRYRHRDRGRCSDARRSTPCAWEWLARNAEGFGFRNLPGEPWHYSPIGR